MLLSKDHSIPRVGFCVVVWSPTSTRQTHTKRNKREENKQINVTKKQSNTSNGLGMTPDFFSQGTLYA